MPRKAFNVWQPVLVMFLCFTMTTSFTVRPLGLPSVCPSLLVLANIPNLCNNSDWSEICAGNLGFSRSTMPQMILSHESKRLAIRKNPNDLIATQDEIFGEKLTTRTCREIIIVSGNRIIDGHIIDGPSVYLMPEHKLIPSNGRQYNLFFFHTWTR